MNLVIRTEVWATPTGPVAKAVVRTTDGRFVGATNQTSNVTAPVIEGRRS